MSLEDSHECYKQLKGVTHSISQKFWDKMQVIMNQNTTNIFKQPDHTSLTDEPSPKSIGSEVMLLNTNNEFKTIPFSHTMIADLQEKEVLEDPLLNKLMANTQLADDMFEVVRNVDVNKVFGMFSRLNTQEDTNQRIDTI